MKKVHLSKSPAKYEKYGKMAKDRTEKFKRVFKEK